MLTSFISFDALALISLPVFQLPSIEINTVGKEEKNIRLSSVLETIKSTGISGGLGLALLSSEWIVSIVSSVKERCVSTCFVSQLTDLFNGLFLENCSDEELTEQLASCPLKESLCSLFNKMNSLSLQDKDSQHEELLSNPKMLKDLFSSLSGDVLSSDGFNETDRDLYRALRWTEIFLKNHF